jgi:hypothetical protein
MRSQEIFARSHISIILDRLSPLGLVQVWCRVRSTQQVLEKIQTFVMMGTLNDWAHGIAAGLIWVGDDLAISTREVIRIT